MVDGVPYRAYLLRRLALFPVKSGQREIGPVEADITTGFLFAGRREHRASQPLSLEGEAAARRERPPGSSPAPWAPGRLGAELTSTRTELGTPVTLRLTVEGRGKREGPRPAPSGAAAPRSSCTTRPPPTRPRRCALASRGGETQEFLVLPQQTGTFEIPAMELAYFDPESGRYERSRTAALTLPWCRASVPARWRQARRAARSLPPGTCSTATALRPLRVSAGMDRPQPPWRTAGSLGLLGLPPLAFVAACSPARRCSVAGRDPTPGERAAPGASSAPGRLARAPRFAGSSWTTSPSPPRWTGRWPTCSLLRLGCPGDRPHPRGAASRVSPMPAHRRSSRPGSSAIQDACDEVRFAPGAAPDRARRGARRRRGARQRMAGGRLMPGDAELLFQQGLAAYGRGDVPRRRAPSAPWWSRGTTARTSSTTSAPPRSRRGRSAWRCSPSSRRAASRRGRGRRGEPHHRPRTAAGSAGRARRPRSRSWSAWRWRPRRRSPVDCSPGCGRSGSSCSRLRLVLRRWRGWLLGGAASALILSLPAAAVLAAHLYSQEAVHEGVVLARTLPVHEVPERRSKVSFELHPGSEAAHARPVGGLRPGAPAERARGVDGSRGCVPPALRPSGSKGRAGSVLRRAVDPRSPFRILVVEDEPVIRELVRSMLDDGPVVVETAGEWRPRGSGGRSGRASTSCSWTWCSRAWTG